MSIEAKPVRAKRETTWEPVLMVDAKYTPMVLFMQMHVGEGKFDLPNGDTVEFMLGTNVGDGGLVVTLKGASGMLHVPTRSMMDAIVKALKSAIGDRTLAEWSDEQDVKQAAEAAKEES